MFDLKLFEKICKKYKIKPKDISLYEQAFTHSSYKVNDKTKKDYERLEFLGDAILTKEVVGYLYKHFPDKDEGFMSKIKISLIKSETLAKISRENDFLELINYGATIKHKKDITGNMLEDVYEALVGAIFLDLGERAAYSFIYNSLIKKFMHEQLGDLNDYKSIVIELAAKLKKKLVYQTEEKNKTFTTNIYADNKILSSATGENKQESEKKASKKLYDLIK
ncbi:MAG: ribonuclease III [Mycoplasmataceae bacterium]|jgi:ribonuclease-3|nr:ribonuclease III [Mycoplasmataceae bacterium]